MTEFTNVRSCPKCGSESITVCDSRVYNKWLRRRRGCNLCGTKFSTVEIPAELFADLRDKDARTKRLQAMLREAIDGPEKQPDPL